MNYPLTNQTITQDALSSTIAEAMATLKPPPRLNVAEWADRERRLSSESSAEAGKWENRILVRAQSLSPERLKITT